MALLTQAELARLPPGDWRRGVYDDLAARLSPPSEFPCVYSQNAFRRGLIRTALVDQPGKAGLRAAGEDIAAYLADCRHWDGQVNSAKPLLIAFSPTVARFDSLEQYRAFGWRALQFWHDHDDTPWPEEVSPVPEQPFWSFCYRGTQLFVNMSTPLHARRKSRNLGRCFILVVNPRERFDVVAGDTPEGRRIRALIRARATAYDGLPHSPLLGSYQKGELEWVQYFLPDGNDTPPGRCPFRVRV